MADRRPDDARRALAEARSMDVFCRLHPLAALRPQMAEAGIMPSGRLRRRPDGDTVRAAGLRIIVHTPPTRSGRRVMFVTLEDEAGLLDLVVFSELQEASAREILTADIIAVEGKLKREGARGLSVSIIGRRIIPAWTGSLERLLSRAVRGGPA